MRTLPPAGTEIDLRALFRCLWGGIRSRDESSLRDAVAAYLGLENVFCISQGRAALSVILETLAEGSRRRNVIVPAYTCYTVPASVVKAGLRVLPVDIQPATLDFDREALERVDCSDVLAVVSSGLYGIPGDLAYLEAFGERRGIPVIDDAAQAFGARLGERHVGTFGKVGFYSLSRGKSISTEEGGILVTRDSDLARVLDRRIGAMPVESALHSYKKLARLLATAFFLNPILYGIPDRLLRLGGSTFDPDFPVRRYDGALSDLGAYLVGRVDAINDSRIANATRLKDMLATDTRVQFVTPPPGAHPIYVRLPIFIRNPETRARILAELRCRGLGATISYPEPVPRIPGVAPHLACACPSPGGTLIAESILTLPTHAHVRAEDMGRIVETIQSCWE